MIQKFKEELNQKEFKLLSVIYQDTVTKIEQNKLHNIGCDALSLSIDLYSDRSNISRLLNKLTRKGILSKIQGRPTLFFDKVSVEHYFPGLFLPEIFPKNSNLATFLEDHYLVESPTISQYQNIFGCGENESLFTLKNEAEAALNYPGHKLSLLLQGPNNTGKKRFANALYTAAVSEGIFINNNSYFFFDCSETSIQENFNNLIEGALHSTNNQNFIAINNFHLLSLEQQIFLNSLIKDRRFYNSNFEQIDINSFFLLITSTELNSHHILYQNFPIKLTMPILENRSMKEKLLFIFNFFQNEANLLKKNIQFSYNVLNCFVLSDYQDNLYGLKLEIRRTIALASYTDKKNTHINVTFDNLSDDLLNNMNNDNQKIDELYRIYSLLDQPIQNSDIVFSPSVESDIFKFIKKNIFYDQQQQPYDKLDIVCPKKILLDYEKESVFLLKKFYQNKGQSLQLYNKDLNELIDTHFKSEQLNHKNALLNGLIFFISHLSQKLDNEIYHPLQNEYTNSPFEIDKNILNFASACEQKLDCKFTSTHLRFIQSYYDAVKSITKKQKITIAIVSGTLENSKIFYDFANSLPYDNKTEILEYSLCSSNDKTFINNLKQLDRGKGVIFLVSDTVPKIIIKKIKEYSTNKIIYDKMSVQNIEKIVRLTNDPFIFLHDLAETLHENSLLVHRDEDELLDILKVDILEKSLVFLNPLKILTSSVNCFYQILEELHLEYTDSVFIRFILHLSFLVERVLFDNILKYHDLHLFINNHHKLHTIIEKHLGIIQTTYNVTIPQSEIAYLSEIFLDHIAELNQKDFSEDIKVEKTSLGISLN